MAKGKSKTTSKKSSSSSSTTRIHNPITNTYYRIRVKSTSTGKKGTIMGKWSPKK